MTFRPGFLPSLLSIGVLFSQVGCPKCSAPVRVEVIVYPCEYAPCEREEEPASVGLDYSFDGGPLLPCDATNCGEESSGCGSDPTGTYRIVARVGDLSEEVTTVVRDYSCIGGGASIEIVLGAPKCPPIATSLGPVAGTATWNVGDTAGDVTFPPAQTQLNADSVVELSRGPEGEIEASERLRVWSTDGNQAWELDFQIGDVRTLAAGQYEIGETMFSRVARICEPDSECSAQGDTGGATLIVEEAQGGPAPWPDIVSDGFLRRYRLVYQTANLIESAVSTTCEGCSVDASISVDLTFVRTDQDYELDEDDHCVVE